VVQGRGLWCQLYVQLVLCNIVHIAKSAGLHRRRGYDWWGQTGLRGPSHEQQPWSIVHVHIIVPKVNKQLPCCLSLPSCSCSAVTGVYLCGRLGSSKARALLRPLSIDVALEKDGSRVTLRDVAFPSKCKPDETDGELYS
jgi:hypothetical protein